MTNKTIYAEDINYWKTGKSRPEVWIDKVVKLLQNIEAESIDTAIINSTNGYFIIIKFVIESDRFCINWQALPSKSGSNLASQIQAATMLYHDTEAKCIALKVKGARRAFFEYLVLPNGQVASLATCPELSAQIPKILLPDN